MTRRLLGEYIIPKIHVVIELTRSHTAYLTTYINYLYSTLEQICVILSTA